MSTLARLRHDVVCTAARPILSLSRRVEERQLRTARPKGDMGPPLVTSALAKELMSRHYLSGRFANGARKVAWVTSGAPVEILRALGFYIFYPETHAALCGARRRVEEIAGAAEEAGFSRDTCSYARTDIGAALSHKTPIGRIPRPDLLVACTNICQTVLYWYRVLADHFGALLYVVDTPFLYDEAAPHQVAYVRRQLEELIPVAEGVARRTLTPRALERVMALAQEAVELWLAVLDRSRHRPAPMTAFDGFITMAPVVDLRGDEAAVRFYRALLRELDHRIHHGIGAVRAERYRLLWDNLPIWPRLARLSRFLAEHGANIVASTYTYAWGELAPMINPAQPLDSAARVYLHPILNRSAKDKLASMRRMVKDFSADGVILHSDRSCKPYSLGQLDQRDRLVSESQIPAVLLEADHADPRAYSDEQVEMRLEAFLETIGEC